ncbi:MAG: YkuS family protein [Sporolactobacillus sp.]
MPTIGVEESITDVVDELKGKGYRIVPLKEITDAKGCDVCVVSGLDTNVFGIKDTTIKGSVIEVSGLTAEEVCRRVEEKFKQMQH